MDRIKAFLPLFVIINLACVAALGVSAGAIYLRVPIDPIIMFTTAFFTLGIYGINRYTDYEDTINDPEKAQLFRSRPYLLVAAIALMILGIISLILAEKFTFVHAVIIFIGIAYSVKIIPIPEKKQHFQFVRIKDIAIIKSSVVSLTFGAAFFAVNWALYPDLIVNKMQATIFLIGSIQFVFIVANFCDIRDVTGDKATGIKTIPSVIGIRKTIIYTILFPSVLWLVVTFVAFQYQVISAPAMIFFLISTFFPLSYLLSYKYNWLGKHGQTILCDGSIALFGLGIIILHFVEKSMGI